MVLVVRFCSDGRWGRRRSRRDALGCKARGGHTAASWLAASSLSWASAAATASAGWRRRKLCSVLFQEGLGLGRIRLVDVLGMGGCWATFFDVKFQFLGALILCWRGPEEARRTHLGVVASIFDEAPIDGRLRRIVRICRGPSRGR